MLPMQKIILYKKRIMFLMSIINSRMHPMWQLLSMQSLLHKLLSILQLFMRYMQCDPLRLLPLQQFNRLSSLPSWISPHQWLLR